MRRLTTEEARRIVSDAKDSALLRLGRLEGEALVEELTNRFEEHAKKLTSVNIRSCDRRFMGEYRLILEALERLEEAEADERAGLPAEEAVGPLADKSEER